MKKALLIVIILVSGIINANGQCPSFFVSTGTTDTLTFFNLSIVPNAHFYWNFGDGSTSYDANPVHIFPESGNYLVTLFGRDTISNCHTFYESWIIVDKPTSDTCQTFITDSIVNISGTDFLVIYDSSVNCSGYYSDYDAGPAQNSPPNNSVWLGAGWSSALFISRVQCTSSDSINGFVLHREYYKTRPYNYSNNLNYDSCSANFEFYIDYQPTGAMVYLKAMNENAASYDFAITGFGNPIHFNTSSASYFYPYITYEKYFPWLIGSFTQDGNGCRDTVWQEIIIHNPYYANPPSCATSLQPQTQTAIPGLSAQFIVSTSPNVVKQWQQNSGLGFVDLSNAGPYIGVKTDTLMILSVQLSMNNNLYRCVISDSSGSGCHNTTLPAALNILTAGINETELQSIRIYPNPASDNLSFILPANLKTAEIKIFNLFGESVVHSILVNQKTKIDISGLSGGVYILEVRSDENRSRQKFVKQ